MLKRTFVLLLVLALSFSIVFTGCGSKETEGDKVDGTTDAKSKDKKTELTMFFPVAVGGPLTSIIDEYARDFNKEYPEIVIKPVYCGSYADTMVKAQTAIKGGSPPDLGVLFSIDLFTLTDIDAIIPLDDYIAKDGGDEYLKDFYPGLMENGQTAGKTWGIPFQRSTIVMYYNKDAYKAANLDPESPPKNWEQLVEYSKKLTVKKGDNVEQWGLQIPSTGYPYWMFQALAIQNGLNLMNSEGNEVYFDKPETIEALQFWCDFGQKHGTMAKGTVEWKTVPSNFLEGKTAMMFHSTGNLTNVKKNAGFEFGVAFLPAKKNYGSPTGGGNLYIFKGVSKENQDAAWKFIKWVTSPEYAADWCKKTGYVGTRKSAWETDTLKNYVNDFKYAAVARDQLEYARAELSTHNCANVVKILDDSIQAALTGSKTPEQAMKDAQEKADKILESFK